VLAPEPEVARWFLPVPQGLLDDLVDTGGLWRPEAGWLAAGR
jgi:hypothetical protein